MTKYRIMCVAKDSSHGHIQGVGTRDLCGNLGDPLSVGQVYALLADVGNTFYTGSSRSGDYAHVARFICMTCGEPTLRSHANDHWNTNLDNLPTCPS